MNYEYLRVYLNNHLRCPSCRQPFLAKEVQKPPAGNVVQDSNISGVCVAVGNLQWGPFSRAAGAASATASSAAAAQAANVVHQTYEKRQEGNDGGPNWKPRPLIHLSLAKTFSQMDLRGLLLEKTKTELKNKLTVIKSKTSQVADEKGDQENCEDPTAIKDSHDSEQTGSNTSTDDENEDDDHLSYN
ncbi:hypothetical protein ACJX0J_020556, partial [Zea mays]